MRTIDQIVECRVRSIEFHDDPNSIELKLSCSKNSLNWLLRLIGVSAFCAWDLRRVNIVDRLRVFEGKQCSRPEVADLVSGAIHGVSASQQVVRSVEIEAIVDRIMSGEAKLLVIDAVYGMELIAIVESYELVNAVA